LNGGKSLGGVLQAQKHVSYAAKKLFGEGTDAAGDWTDAIRAALLSAA
jgi:hypothetical protein